VIAAHRSAKTRAPIRRGTDEQGALRVRSLSRYATGKQVGVSTCSITKLPWIIHPTLAECDLFLKHMHAALRTLVYPPLHFFQVRVLVYPFVAHSSGVRIRTSCLDGADSTALTSSQLVDYVASLHFLFARLKTTKRIT
jgi:hypothetical protein